MNTIKRLSNFFCVFLGLTLAGQAQAQTPEPAATAAEASPFAPATTPAPVAVPAESCRIVTDRAMAADLRAANAQAQKHDATQMARLLDEAMGLWALATERCTDRAQDRARRNLADSQRTRQALSTELGTGAECASRQTDASSLQDLAQQAVKARRWLDAAVLYRKAENMWDVAAERCTGEPQKLALQRREQTATDAHNAEFCAPSFERAREATQTLSRQSDPAQKAARQTQSQVAETLWRDAIAQCKGQPLDIAHTNAQRLAKERGTPWVPTQTAIATPAPTAPPTATEAKASVPAAKADTTDAPSSPPANTTAPTPGPQDTDIQSGDTRFQGRFVRQGNLLTGSGRVTWANGDVYNGELQQGQRHGQGEFVWANGQRYRGDWVQDMPHGDGRMVFASGDSFQGRFVQGKPNGQGTYRWSSGQTYEGPWSQDQPNGTGKLVYANGNRYEGALVNGAPEGLGRLAYASGDEYRGQFSQGAPHGEGTYTWKSGDRYAGLWQAGRKHGQGRFEWPNGDRWDGLFDNDTQTDKGTLTRKAP